VNAAGDHRTAHRPQRRRWVVALGAVAIFSGLAIVTWRQLGRSHGSETLVRDAPVEDGVARGNRLARDGRFVEAAAAYGEAIASRPDRAEAHHHLGIALAAQGRPSAALRSFEEALRLSPRLPAASYNLGVALAQLGRTREAADRFRDELSRDPHSAEAALQLAWILAVDPDPHLRNGPEAVRWAEEAAAASGPRDPAAVDVFAALAAAYAEAGRLSDAAAAARRGAEGARAAGDFRRAREMEEESRAYADRVRPRAGAIEPRP
jgi:tetratricopeptide (TPR) repeat protein